MPAIALLEYLKNNILVADGAAGTLFYARGVPLSICYDHLNLGRPDVVRQMHADYYAAGARLIETNTFGANKSKLQYFGHGDLVREINLAGVEIARKAAGADAYIAGSVGPLWQSKERIDVYSPQEMEDQYHEQISALVEGGVDILQLETFQSDREFAAALKVARKLGKGLPVIAQMTFTKTGRSLNGVTIAQAVAIAESGGASVIGANCSVGSLYLIDIVRQIAELTDLPISAMPNAGFPEYHDGRIIYMTTADYMASSAVEMVRQGANIVGGCCGTTPEHIAAIAAKVAKLKPVARHKQQRVHIKAKTEVIELIDTPAEMDVLRHLGKKHIITVELDPPKGIDYSTVARGAELLCAEGIDGINFAENPLGRARMSAVALGHLIQQRFHVPAIVHVTCRDRNYLGLYSELLGAAALKIASILAITGDPISAGDFPWATGVFDINSFDLIKMISQMNSGLGANGEKLDFKTKFTIGVAFNASHDSFDNEVTRLKKKIDRGAQYAQTQPLYDIEKIKRLYDAVHKLNFPVLMGVLPPASLRNAEFLHNEFPGITIPDAFRAQIARARDKDDEKRIIQDLMTEFTLAVRDIVPGYYIIPQFNRFKTARALLRAIRRG